MHLDLDGLAILRKQLYEERAVANKAARDAAVRAEQSWRKKKGPMAVYWKAVSVYAKHIGRALKGSR